VALLANILWLNIINIFTLTIFTQEYFLLLVMLSVTGWQVNSVVQRKKNLFTVCTDVWIPGHFCDNVGLRV